ncbi:hypothetical protein M1432_00320 [Patescibacteria group bacterium]|nr:hypothetical protein [Patescibacteria group bacterium]
MASISLPRRRAIFIAAILAIPALIAAPAASLADASGTSAPAGQSASLAGQASTSLASLQGEINANYAQINALNQQISAYQAQLQQIGANKQTLQQAVNALDLRRKEVEAQVQATEHQINVTQLQIQQSGTDIVNAKSQIVADQAALGESLRALQTADDQSLVMQIFSSDNISQAWDDTNALFQLQNNFEQDIQTLRAQESQLADLQTASKQKQVTLSSQQQSLSSQQQSLVATESEKTALLTETKAQESVYEQLLAEAEAELNGFTTFAQNAGGSKLLVNQTSCDSWGCYYNQRDAAWGNDPLDGTRYNLASDGCLITAMAMVMTHYGYRDITPVTINTNPDNFATYYPALLMTTISAGGVTATRVSAYIDSTLATGNPVIVGVRAYGGTHFVVLVSGRRGNYVMKDPYVQNGNDVNFASHYSFRSIFAVSKVVIKG